MESQPTGRHSGASWAHVPPTFEAWYALGVAEGERRAAERPRERRTEPRNPSTAELRIIHGGRGA